MSQLRFALLGPPEVHHGEQILSFSTRKALALLIYLSVEGGTHARKTLSEWFWPDRDAEHGRALLRGAVQQLREGLGNGHASGERTHLLIDRDLLSLDLSSDVDLDLQMLQAASKLAQEPLHTTPNRSADTHIEVLKVSRTTRIRFPLQCLGG